MSTGGGGSIARIAPRTVPGHGCDDASRRRHAANAHATVQNSRLALLFFLRFAKSRRRPGPKSGLPCGTSVAVYIFSLPRRRNLRANKILLNSGRSVSSLPFVASCLSKRFSAATLQKIREAHRRRWAKVRGRLNGVLGNDASAWITGAKPYIAGKHGPPGEDSHSGRADCRARQIARTHIPRGGLRRLSLGTPARGKCGFGSKRAVKWNS